MATNDEENETPEERKGRRLAGVQMAMADASVVLEFAGAYDRVVTLADVTAAKTVGQLVSDLLNAKYDEIAGS